MASQKYLDLLNDPSANTIYLLTLTGYDPVLGTSVTLYHCLPGSARGFVSAPGDSPANTIFVPDVEGVSWVEDLFGPDGEPGGRTAPAECRIRLVNTDGHLDHYQRIDWRRCTIVMGGDDFALGEFEPVFAGRGEGVEQDEQRVTLLFRDDQYRLDRPVQDQLYAGTGGIEGGPPLQDKRLPILLGIGRNIAPDFLGHLPDGAGGFLPAWRFHDGAVQAYDAALHRFWMAGVPIEHAASFPPAAGKWHLDATTGTAWFNGAITGEVTLDALGQDGVATLGEAVRAIGVRCGFADPAEIDTAAFAQADTDLPAAIGLYLNAGENALDALDRICGPLGFAYRVDLAGKLTLAQFQGPQGTPALVLNEQQIAADRGMPREHSAAPAWRQTIGYRRNWTLQSPDRLALVYTNPVSTPNFATDTDWSKGTGWTIGSGVATGAAGSASSLTQDLTLVAGQEYSITFDLTRSAGQVQVRMEGLDLGAPIAATGAYRRDFVAAGALNQTLEFAKDATFAGTIDNVIVLPSRAEFVQAEGLTAVVEDAAIKTAVELAGEDRRDTCLDDRADALAEATRQFALRNTRRDRYAPSCFIHPLRLALGQEINVAFPRHGLDEGKDFILVGRRVELPGKRVEVVLWG